MNRIDYYRFQLEGTIDYLRGQVHLDLHEGVKQTATRQLISDKELLLGSDTDNIADFAGGE